MQTSPFYRHFTHTGIWEFFTNSWRTFGVAWTTFLLLGVFYVIVLEGLELGADTLMDLQDLRWDAALVVAYIIVSWLILSVTTLAMTITADRASDGETMDVWEGYGLSLSFGRLRRYIATWMLYFLIVSLGSLLLIIPGIIWGVRYVLAPYAAVVEDLSARQALSRSATLTKGRTWRILLHELGCGILISLACWIPVLLLIWLIAAILGEPFFPVPSADPLQIQSEAPQLPPTVGWRQAIQSFAYIAAQALYIIFNVLLLKSLRLDWLGSNQMP